MRPSSKWQREKAVRNGNKIWNFSPCCEYVTIKLLKHHILDFILCVLLLNNIYKWIKRQWHKCRVLFIYVVYDIYVYLLKFFVLPFYFSIYLKNHLFFLCLEYFSFGKLTTYVVRALCSSGVQFCPITSQVTYLYKCI